MGCLYGLGTLPPLWVEVIPCGQGTVLSFRHAFLLLCSLERVWGGGGWGGGPREVGEVLPKLTPVLLASGPDSYVSLQKRKN